MSKERVRTLRRTQRLGTFGEVHLGLSRGEAVENARLFLERERGVRGAPCPLTEDYFAILRPLARGDVRAAASLLAAANPLAGLTARFAAEPWPETQVFNRNGERVSLRAIERFLADRFDMPARPVGMPAGGRRTRVAVIGTGPAGLMAAFFLQRSGAEVTLFDRLHRSGGMLAARYPEFRLPGRVVAMAVSRLEAEGAVFRNNVLVPRTVGVNELLEEQGYGAVLLCCGGVAPELPDIPGVSAVGVMTAPDVLRDVRLWGAGRPGGAKPSLLGRKVVVAGNTEMALDVARCAVRLGSETLLVIPGSESDMRAPAGLVRDTTDEGVRIRSYATLVRVVSGLTGCVKSLVFRPRTLRNLAGGRSQAVEDAEAEFEVETDTVVVADPLKADTVFLGEVPGLELDLDGAVTIREGSSATSLRKVFAAGQVVRPDLSLLDILLDARRAAHEISIFLKS